MQQKRESNAMHHEKERAMQRAAKKREQCDALQKRESHMP